MTDLGLEVQAKQHFDFLITDYGFRCTGSTPDSVSFRSDLVTVELFLERSYQLDLLVGCIGSKGLEPPRFYIGEILRLRGVQDAARLSTVLVTSPESTARFVAKFSRLIRMYGADFIEGNEASFAEVAELRQRESQTYMRELALTQARTVAESAWHRRDYRALIEAFEPLQDALTTSERGKLDYAKKHHSC